jgi:hypothetical protein
VKPKAGVLARTNRLGVTYYLHEGTTKTGKPRYFFARTVRDGALDKVPDGYEVTESINGVVSIQKCRVEQDPIPEADVKAVESALRGQGHLRWHAVRAVGKAIVIYEPSTGPARVGEYARQLGMALPPAAYFKELMARAKYDAVMKFERDGDEYVALRMTYRGAGGWSWPLASGTLPDLVRQLVPLIGTEAFFELM